MQARNRAKTKTWSLLGDVKRKPTEYEVVTARFLHNFRRQPAPFDISPNAPINRWFLKYREGSPFQVDDWEAFRDPYRLTYRRYVAQQHDREIYLDLLIDEHEAVESLRILGPEWVQTLRRLVIPMRFPLHVLQMTGSYIAQMAPSAFIINSAAFQAADEMRRIQRLAYWTKALSLIHGDDLAATPAARQAWETEPAWQPLRRVLERLLTVRDWGEAFAALNLMVKPTLDAMVNGSLASLARVNGDEFLAALLTEFEHDSRRSREWSTALVGYAVERRPELQLILKSWIEGWEPLTQDAVTALSELFATAPTPMSPQDVVTLAADEVAEFHKWGQVTLSSV